MSLSSRRCLVACGSFLAATSALSPAGAQAPSAPPTNPPADVVADAQPPRIQPSGFNVSVSAETAGGISSRFRNHMLGARLMYRFDPRISFGGYLGAVSLKGKNGRAANLLPYAALEYRVPFDRAGRWGMPLRFGTGYLPNNGPFLRVGPAFAVPIGDTIDLVVDFLVPTLWVTQKRPEYSLNFSAELLLRM